MRVEKFKASSSDKVSNLIIKHISNISYNQVMKLLRNKDIKVNGKRISKDCIVEVDDEIIFYIKEDIISRKLDVIFEDDNVIVIFKPRKLEVENNTEDCALNIIKKQIGQDCFAVHRLDRNTTGLLIFAKNLESKNSLDKAIKDRKIDKYYLALLVGMLNKNQDNMIAYLKKDNKKSFVEICDFPQKGYEKIETIYKIVEKYENLSLVDIKLVTGKTHQIRAHFSHIGYPILGDEKYGNTIFNKMMKTKYQCLCAYKLQFNFTKDDYLSYLNSIKIELNKEKIDFLKFYK